MLGGRWLWGGGRPPARQRPGLRCSSPLLIRQPPPRPSPSPPSPHPRPTPPGPGSPDLVAARKVADFLGTDHTEFTFTVQEGIDALSDLIYHIESYEQVGGLGGGPCCVCCWGWVWGRRPSVEEGGRVPRVRADDRVGQGGWPAAAAQNIPPPPHHSRRPTAHPPRHPGARRGAHVPAQPAHQGDGHEGSAERRGRGRDLWRLPLLPQGAQPGWVGVA